MAAVAHDPGFAKRVGVPQKVGKDFNSADAGTGILGKRGRGRHRLAQGNTAKERTGKLKAYIGP